MSPSPVSGDDRSGMEQYSAAWQAIMELVRKGSSWSGYERNCCFLNTGGPFADASHLSGLDFPDDGRGVAVTDWDQDGDLDIWFSNRTAPRLRLMLNQASHDNSGRSVAFRLVGKSCNRDAIGAVLELEMEDQEHRFVRSARAGEMFLSQSSKWVHFGLPDQALIKKVTVLWPGGERSSYSGIELGRRYQLQQGAAKATVVPARRADALALKAAPLATRVTSTAAAAIVLPAPVPIPIDTYIDPTGSEITLAPNSKARLLTLWSAGCPHCKQELGQLAKFAKSTSGRLEMLALCVDENTSEAREAAKALISQTGFPGSWGMIGADALEQVQVVQGALFDKTPDFAVPLSLLMRPGNEVVALYRGVIPEAVLSHDLTHVVPASDATLRNLAPPFPGRWFTQPAAPAFVPNMIARRIQARYPEQAVFWLHAAADRSTGTQRQEMVAELARKHYSLARKFVDKRMAPEAVHHFTQSLEAAPNSAETHNDFGTLLAQLGRMKDAEHHFAEAVRLKPDYPLAQKNLAKARELLGQ
ncbi:MAG: ASPIC/UnbV domain-containing protein [Verrucomicrobia bacterium]|nr:ASPIC/UnbV domain-containing protein [Verrucomicrobiota bacterium]